MNNQVKVQRVFLLLLCVLMAFSFAACGNGNERELPQTEEGKVRSKVTSYGSIAFIGKSIGGNDLKSSSVVVTTVSKESDTEYTVNGTITMTDVYGTKWSNRFDCTVVSYDDGESWNVAGGFDYKSDSWSKE